ncbi:CRISPR-associated endonuclease Cas1 [Thermodesulfobacteriota bacterium]
MTTSPTKLDDGYLTPLRGLNEFVYCPRLFHLMYVQELFEDSIDTLSGRIAHKKRLNRGKATSAQKKDVQETVPWRMDLVRELSLSSKTLGIFGKFDVLLSEGEKVVPVEVKRGPAPEGTEPFHIGPNQLSACAWGNDQIQLAAQMSLLREAGHCCTHGRIYYQRNEKLVEIPWDDNLYETLLWVADQTRAMISATMPEPLMDSKKCIRCSLNHVCLPDETLHMKKKLDEPRQLYPGRDDCGVLHLITPGTYLGKSGNAVKITTPDEKGILLPMKDIAHVCCWGNSQLSTQTMLELADRGVGITWLTGGGWLRATTTAPLEKNVHLRRSQYRACDNPAICLKLARWIITSKIENQRVLVRRNNKSSPAKKILKILRACHDNASKADNIEILRGIEGYAAKIYWDAFSSMFREKTGEKFVMCGRNKRPPKDPVNALLSFGYSMLLRDFVTALHGVGMDPLYGFYHAVVPGRPALALDMMEAFRPLIVDSTVLRSINEGVLSTKDFVQTKNFCSMKPHAKKRWIKAYERRVDEMVTHPVFGYRLSYRRIFTLEARLLGRYISGEFPEYHPLTTR